MNCEIKNEFAVTEKRRKLWNIEMNIMKDIKRVCSDNNINYFLIYGAALGAIRHNGFIPWDDDIDIGMLRKDFNKFLKVYKQYGNKKYYLQYGYSDIGEESTFLRIRDSASTAIIRSQKNKKCNHGVFVEIYPYDFVPNNKIIRFFHLKICTILKVLLDERFNGILASGGCMKCIRILTKAVSTPILWNVWEWSCSLFNKENCTYVSTPAMPIYEKAGDVYCREYIEGVKQCKFENTILFVPLGVEKMLKQNYGNYMEFPPIEERGKYHEKIVFFDPNRSYLDYENSEIIDDYFNGLVSIDL